MTSGISRPDTSRLLKKQGLRSNLSMFEAAANRRWGGGLRRRWRVRWVFGSYSTLRAGSSRRRQNCRDANEIVGGRGKDEEPFYQLTPAVPGLAQSAAGLDPAERLLDLLALDHADCVSGMAGGASVDRGAAADIVLGDVRHAATLAATGYEIGRVITLVAPNGAAGTRVVGDHVESGLAFGGSGRRRHPGVDDQTVTVLRHQMSHMAELGLFARALAKQTRVGVGGRGMGVIEALFAAEIALAIAAASTASRRRRTPA